MINTAMIAKIVSKTGNPSSGRLMVKIISRAASWWKEWLGKQITAITLTSETDCKRTANLSGSDYS
jgi:hypothetical protein